MSKLLRELVDLTGNTLTNLIVDKTILIEINNDILLEAINFYDACNQIESLI